MGEPVRQSLTNTEKAWHSKLRTILGDGTGSIRRAEHSPKRYRFEQLESYASVDEAIGIVEDEKWMTH